MGRPLAVCHLLFSASTHTHAVISVGAQKYQSLKIQPFSCYQDNALLTSEPFLHGNSTKIGTSQAVL